MIKRVGCFAFCHALDITCLLSVGELRLYAVKLWCLHLQIYSRGNHASSVGHQAAFDCQVWPLLFIKLKNLSQKLSPPFYKPHRAGQTEWSLATFILLNSGCSCLSTMATFIFGTTRASSLSSRLRWETIFSLAGVRSSFSHLQVCDLPVRAAVFVPRKNWVVTGSDDMQVNIIFTFIFWLILTS